MPQDLTDDQRAFREPSSRRSVASWTAIGPSTTAPTAFLTWRANTRSGIFQPAHANPGGGITRAENHLSTDHKLFKIDEPPLSEQGK